MWFRANKYLSAGVVLLLWAGLLAIRPIPPVCPLPGGGSETVRYAGEDIYRPLQQALSASVTLHLFPLCFGAIRKTNGFGWAYGTAAVVQKQSYAMFVRQTGLNPKILSGLGGALLFWHVLLLFHKRYRRKKTV